MAWNSVEMMPNRSTKVMCLLKICRTLFVLVLIAFVFSLVYSCWMLVQEKRVGQMRVELLAREITGLRQRVSNSEKSAGETHAKLSEIQRQHSECQNHDREMSKKFEEEQRRALESLKSINELKAKITNKDEELKKIQKMLTSLTDISNGNNQGDRVLLPVVGSVLPTGLCQRWKIEKDTNSVGAKIESRFVTLEDCQAFCIATPQCVVIDFDTVAAEPGRRCWVHTSPVGTGPADVYFQKGTNQYRLDRNCAQSPAAPVQIQNTAGLPQMGPLQGQQQQAAAQVQQNVFYKPVGQPELQRFREKIIAKPTSEQK